MSGARSIACGRTRDNLEADDVDRPGTPSIRPCAATRSNARREREPRFVIRTSSRAAGAGAAGDPAQK